MGFYIEMNQMGSPEEHFFAEKGVPYVFWVLYGIALFAVVCMTAAAFSVLRDLYINGSTWDRYFLMSLSLFFPLVVGIGLKLAFIRKFVDFHGDKLVVGFKILTNGPILYSRKLPKVGVKGVYLLNRKQTPNQALREHKDLRYQIRGHWRVVAEYQNKKFVLDRHTEREALVPLYGELNRWLAV